jgi:hypothetical protein
MRKVIIFLPLAKGSVDREFFESYSQAKTYLFSKATDLPFQFQLVEYYAHTFPIDANRNECAVRFLEGIPMQGGVYKADTSIWLDTDHTVPQDTFYRLLAHDRPIVLGIYYLKVTHPDKPFYPVIFKAREDAPGLYKAIMDFPEDKLFEIDMAGMGCACIKREVFEKLERPYFKYMQHPTGSSDPHSQWKHESGIEDVTEDVWFWKNVKEKTPWPILVDPQIQLGHLGKMIFDKYMYRGWLATYKQRLIEQYGEVVFEKKWNEFAVATPYKEIKIEPVKGSKRSARLSKVS